MVAFCRVERDVKQYFFIPNLLHPEKLESFGINNLPKGQRKAEAENLCISIIIMNFC